MINGVIFYREGSPLCLLLLHDGKANYKKMKEKKSCSVLSE